MTDPTTFNAFTWAPPSTLTTPQQRQQAVVDALMQQAGDTSAAQSAWQGASRATAGLAAGILSDPNWKLGNLFGAAPKPAPVASGTADLY